MAVEAGLLDKSPIKGKWVLPRLDPVERHPLTLAEMNDLRAIFHDMPIVQWIALTGQRPSDARALEFRQVNLDTRTVDRGSKKSRDIRKFEISSKAAAVVAQEARREHDGSDIVFVSSRGTAWSADGLLNSFKARLRDVKYKRDLNLRDLRHSFASIMANEIGIPVTELRILMGHTDIKTTMKYVHARGAREWLDVMDKRL